MRQAVQKAAGCLPQQLTWGSQALRRYTQTNPYA